MIDALIEPLQQGLVRRAALELVLLGLVCGPLGTWVLLFRHSFAAESIAHAMLPGLVLAALAGLPLVLGAGAGVLAAAAAVSLAGRDPRIGPDVGTAVAVTALFGAGALLALAPDAPARLEELLFGDLIGIGVDELLLTLGLAAAIAAALAAAHRPLALTAFDAGSAGPLGARPGRTELTLLALLALTVATAVQALGNLLVVALIVAPAAAARRLTQRLLPALLLSSALAAAAGVVGLYASYYLELAAGAAVALAAVLTFALTLPVRRSANRPARSVRSGEALGEAG